MAAIELTIGMHIQAWYVHQSKRGRIDLAESTTELMIGSSGSL